MARSAPIGSSSHIYFFTVPRIWGRAVLMVELNFLLSNHLSYSNIIVNMLELINMAIMNWNPCAHRASKTANPI